MAVTTAHKRGVQARGTQEAPARLHEAVAWLERHATARTRAGLARYGVVTADRVLGVSVADIQTLAKRLGRDHALAAALWDTGVFEARMLAAFVDEPDRVTPAQMDRWCRTFDNWAICDTLCFHLFDRTPHAWAKVTLWNRSRHEYTKRTAFALLWSLALHDKGTGEKPFLQGLRLIERAATDERHFVKKAVGMALRAVGRRSGALHVEAMRVAERLAASDAPAARWVSRDALRTLTRTAPGPAPPRDPQPRRRQQPRG